jgi:hypothetical protein
VNRKHSRNLSQSIRSKLLQHSKQKKVDFNNEVTRYALDRFLDRLSQSEYKNKIVNGYKSIFWILDSCFCNSWRVVSNQPFSQASSNSLQF